MKKYILITGATSGIGLAFVKALVNQDVEIHTISRNPYEFNHEKIHHHCADVTSEEDLEKVFQELSTLPGLDYVYHCAGFGISGAVEFTTAVEAKRQMDVNFIGSVLVAKYATPLLRKRKGRLTLISSVAGVIPIPFQSIYSASKAAINSFAMALANELRPFGIKVLCIMPGDIKTNFTTKRTKLHEGDDVYQGRIHRSVSKMEKDELAGLPPERIIPRIIALSRKKNPKVLYGIGWDYRTFLMIYKFAPSRFANWVLHQLYSK